MTDFEIAQRLEKLERDNRRLKRLGIAALALTAALGLMAATRPVPNVIKAHRFEVVDSTGKARIRMDLGAMHWPEIVLSDAKGYEDAQLYVTDAAGILYLQNRPPKERPSTTSPQMPAPPARLYDERSQGEYPSVMWLDNQGITFRDSEGYEMDLGRVMTTTKGESTSAASIVMFNNDKEHHVIWKAP